MKYIAADGTGSPFDLQRNFGDALIKAGLVKEYVPPVQSKKADTAWGVARFADGKPYVSGTCRTCSGKYVLATFDLGRLTPFVHCGVQENVPADVVNQYRKAVEAFTPKAPVERKTEKVFLNI